MVTDVCGSSNRINHISVKPRTVLKSPTSSAILQVTEECERSKRMSVYGIENAKRGVAETFWHLVDQYGKQTTVHGLDRICQRRTGRKERIFWMLSFFAALYLLIGMYALISERYRRKQFQTTLNETFYKTYRVPFPEIIICNANRLNWGRIEAAMDRFLDPVHRTAVWENLFMEIMTRFDTATVFNMKIFQDLAGEPLNAFNHINFTEVVEFMSWRCDEILANCTWRQASYDCCEIFYPRRFNLGNCLAFNSILTDHGKNKSIQDSYWPWRYGGSGRGSGLTFRVLIREELHSPRSTNKKGILFMPVDPDAYTDYFYTGANAGTVIYASIGGSLTYYDKLTRSVSSKDRQCVFDDERNSEDFQTLAGYAYNFENCCFECQQKYILDSCHCTLDLFFPAGPYPVCRIIDMPCLAEKWDNFNHFAAFGESKMFGSRYFKGMECNCLLNCYSLLYENKINIEEQSPEQRAQVNGSYVDLDFHWGLNFILTYKTSLVFTWLDLLVSFGGIASLLLGCSVISFVELIFFLLCDVPGIIRRKYWSDKRLEALKREQNVKNLLYYDSTH